MLRIYCCAQHEEVGDALVMRNQVPPLTGLTVLIGAHQIKVPVLTE
jgi:hypothetical protein